LLFVSWMKGDPSMTLTKLACVLALPLAASLAFAQQPPQPAPAQETPQAPPAAVVPPETTGTKEVPAEVVSADTLARSIKVKVMVKKDAASAAEQKEAVLPVDDEAVTDLATLNAGDKVKLLCRMSGNKVIAVKDISRSAAPEPAPAETTPPPSQP
jgi:hypothetical protein